ncbi:hypothetical protein SISNIDRAFT_450644 [Sistotremastrum niveocremeum HHB9708]|uniref:Uncharacterized protein n=1 Tax=Sistotremastrum niveocremeum HHB9708 TaxID=1314777 RepID=A0A164YGD5_9AGAM|nr:hypothetical protein SISNIDRAFT_450644 [Sistotremastrum niveocremeum HHB9708]
MRDIKWEDCVAYDQSMQTMTRAIWLMTRAYANTISDRLTDDELLVACQNLTFGFMTPQTQPQYPKWNFCWAIADLYMLRLVKDRFQTDKLIRLFGMPVMEAIWEADINMDDIQAELDLAKRDALTLQSHIQDILHGTSSETYHMSHW